MKTLTYAQRRWALASALTIALTATAFYQSPAQEVYSRDLASSDVISTNLATDQGVVEVKYIKDGKKVMAVVPRTEGQATCDYCGTYTLDISFDENKKDLQLFNVALLQAIKEDPRVTRLPKADKEEESVQEDGGKVSGEASLFADIEKRCDKKDAERKATCLTGELAKKLSKNKKLDEAEVILFYKEVVAESIKEVVTESQETVRELSINRKQYSQEDAYLLGIDPLAQQIEREEIMGAASDAREKIESARKEIAENLKALIKSTGSSYRKLRAEITKTVTGTLEESALQVRALRMMAVKDLENKNHAGFVEKSLEADNMRNEISEWAYKSINGIDRGLSALSDRKEIKAEERNLYAKYIEQFQKNLTEILKSPTYNADGTVTMPQAQVTPLGQAATQIQREGLTNIGGQTVQLSPELIARIKAETGVATPMVAQQIQTQQIQVVPTASPVQDGFYTDGGAYNATPELIQQRDQIRSQFGPRP